MSKIYSLKDAISKFVEDGDVISFGGFTTNRKPYAAVYEILRQGKKDFIAEAGPAGGDWDMMIGENRVKAYINCYTANSGYTNVSRRFRKAIEAGTLLFEDYSQDVEMLRLHAASLGLPYLPVKLMMGTDLVDKWGISKEERQKIDKLPNDKYVYVENPFNGDKKVVAVPVPVIDTAVIHVQVASPDGTCRIIGDEFHDVDIAVAARKTIVTCEELVSNEEIRLDPTLNSIPGFCVDAVVHLPYGAHPSQCYDYYDYDSSFYKMYDVVSKDEESFNNYMKEWVYDIEDHNQYLDKLGATRLLNLKPVKGFGYATNVLKEVK
ncbi:MULTISPECIES: glutaconate CoA-transferase subunit A [Peptoniphilus]|uniref:glutaconate CoA-transferase subunit A n=1 Tax=Peptoniphilus TaxID=162289 RepID=UPI0001DA99B6|nr:MULTISPECIES: glutaconate CoA-transferase subunit A [Peptoniphilus]EFI41744.1 glutaconate CoA-transferase subunit A [Peptoniphilus sp. oral taxon 386 str. F0131]